MLSSLPYNKRKQEVLCLLHIMHCIQSGMDSRVHRELFFLPVLPMQLEKLFPIRHWGKTAFHYRHQSWVHHGGQKEYPSSSHPGFVFPFQQFSMLQNSSDFFEKHNLDLLKTAFVLFRAPCLLCCSSYGPESVGTQPGRSAVGSFWLLFFFFNKSNSGFGILDVGFSSWKNEIEKSLMICSFTIFQCQCTI